MRGKSNIDDSNTKSAEFFAKARRGEHIGSKTNSFSWQNISVRSQQKETEGLWRRTKYRDIQILKNVSGFVSQGSLVAIMGPSGSGKTTLLAAISHRIKDGVSGNIYINGETIGSPQMMTLSGFVPQEDLMVRSLTVLEHMKMMAVLKMDRNITEIQRLRKILLIMDDIGITDIASSYLCNLSGGERRKLSIAVQMLTDPLLLFCDEPTTGLDSANTAVVVKMLKKFSTEGKIVICSIHQPAASAFELFDNVLLLASGGRVAYYGSVSNSIDHFRRLNFVCPPSYNIAEFLINKISNSDPQARERVRILCDIFAGSKSAAIMQERIKAARFDSYLSSDECSFFMEYKQNQENLTHYYTTEKASLSTQCTLLIKRSFLDLRKNYQNFLAHMLTYLFTATMISLIYAEVNLCSENSLQNIRGYLNCMVLETIYEFAYYEFNTFGEERALFMREISNGLYSTEAYCISKLCGKLLVSMVLPVIYVTIMQTFSNACDHLLFWELATPFILIAAMSSAYGCMMSVIFDNVNILLVVAAGYETPAYQFAGITLKLSSLSPVMDSLRYLSFFYYAIEYITVLEWQKATNIRCIGNDGPDKSNIKQLSPLEFLEEYGFAVKNYRDNMWIMFLLTIMFYFIAYKVVVRKSKGQAAY